MNGVSRIHGAVSSRLCADQWPEVPPEQKSGRLRHQWRACADLPGADVEPFLRRRAGAGVARAALGPRLLAHHHKCRDYDFWHTAQQVKARMLEGVRARLRANIAPRT